LWSMLQWVREEKGEFRTLFGALTVRRRNSFSWGEEGKGETAEKGLGFADGERGCRRREWLRTIKTFSAPTKKVHNFRSKWAKGSRKRGAISSDWPRGQKEGGQQRL